MFTILLYDCKADFREKSGIFMNKSILNQWVWPGFRKEGRERKSKLESARTFDAKRYKIGEEARVNNFYLYLNFETLILIS